MTSVVAPPRKNKRSPEKKVVELQKSIPLTDKGDEMTMSAELQTEDKTFKPTMPATMEVTKTTSVEQTRIEITQLKPQRTTRASEPHTAQSSDTEMQPKAVQQDITAEPVVKPAAGEPVLIQKVIEQSASGVEKTTPVASRRKSKTLAVDTEPAKTKLEPEVVKTIITQVSPSTGTATVGEIRNIETITPGVSEPFITEQAEIVVLKDTKLTPTGRKSKEGPDSQKPTEITETTVAEKAKLSPTKKKSKGLKISPELTTEDVTPSRRKSKEGTQGQKPSEIAEPVLEKSDLYKGLKLSPESTTAELAKSREEPDSQKPPSAPELVTITTEISVVEKSDLSPTKRKSKGLKLSSELSTEDVTETMKEPDRQKSSEQTEVAVLEEIKVVPSRRKSKEGPQDQKPSEQTEAAVLEKGDLSPTKRKSKGLKPFLEIGSTELTKTTEELYSQKPSSAPGGVTGPTEIIAAEKGKLSPTTRQSKGLKLSPEAVTTELAQTKEEPESQKPPLSSRVQTEMVVDEETKIATIILDVSEPLTTEQTETVVLKERKLIPTRRKTKEDPDSQKQTEVAGATVLEKGDLSPTKRKSKGLKLSPESATTELTQTKEEPESQKHSLSSRVQTGPIAVEETKNIATIILDVSEPTEKTETIVLKETELIPTRPKSKEDSDSQKPTEIKETTVLEKGKLSPTKRQSKALKLSPELAVVQETKTILTRKKSKESPDGQKPTKITETTVLEKGDFFPKLGTTDLTETKEETESQKPPSTPGMTTGPTESTGVDKGKLSPTKRKSKGLKVAPELATTELKQTKDEPDSQNLSLSSKVPTETGVVEETKNIATIILDIPEPFTSVPVKTDPEALPTEKKSMSLEVSTVPESLSSLGRTTGVESRETKQGPENDPAVPEFVQRQAETAIVQQTKILPPKRKSKSAELPLKHADTDEPQTREGPEGQKFSFSSNDQNPSVVIEESKHVPTRRKSKSGNISTTSETVTQDRSLDVEPDQKNKESKRKLSTPEEVTATTEITVEKSVLSLTERKSKGLKFSPESATAELEKSRKEPDSQKSSSAPEMVTTSPQTTIAEKDTLSPTQRVSKGVKAPSELPTTKLTKTKEDPDSQKPSSAPELVTITTEISTVEKSVLSPTKRKSKGLKLSPEPATAELAKGREEPDSQKPSSAPEVVTTTSQTMVVEKSTLLPTKRESCEVPQTQPPLAIKPTDTPNLADYIKNLWKNTDENEKRYIVLDLPDTGVTQTGKIKPHQPEADTVVDSDSTPPTSTVFAVAEAEFSGISSTEQDKPLETTSQLKPPETTKERPKEYRELGVKDEHAKLSPEPQSKDTTSTDIQKEKAAVKLTRVEVQESMSKCQDSVAKGDSKQPTSAVVTAVQPSEAETVLQISSSKQDTVTTSQKLEVLSTTQERPTDFKEYDAPVKHGKVLTHDVHDEPKSLDEKSVKKIHLGPEVCVLEIDIQTRPDKENTSVLRAKGIDIVQTSIQREGEPQNKDMSSAEFKPEEGAVKMTTTEVRESSTDGQDNMAPRDSAQPPTASKALPVDEEGTECIEICFSEQDLVKPSQTEIQKGLLKTTQKEHKVVKEHGVQEQKLDSVPKSLDEKSVSMEKIHMGPEVRILKADTTTSLGDDKNTSVTKEPRVDVGLTSIQGDRVPENKGIPPADGRPERAAAEKVKVQVSSTKGQDKVPQMGSAKPTSPVSETLQPHVTETEFIEINLYEQDILKPSQTETKTELLKSTQGKPTEVKEHGLRDEHPKVPTHGVQGVPKHMDEKSVKTERIPKPDTQATVKEHEIISVEISKAPTVDVDQTSIPCEKVPETKDLTSAAVQPEKDKVKMTMVEVKTKELDHQEQHPTVSTHDVDGATKSVDRKSITMEKIIKGADEGLQQNIPVVQVEEENISVVLTKKPRKVEVQTSIQGEKVPEIKDKTSADVHPKKAAGETRAEVQEIKTERQEIVTEGDSTSLPTSAILAAAQPRDPGREFVTISLSEQAQSKPSQTGTQLELTKTTQDRPEEVKEPLVHGLPKSLEQKSVDMEEIQQTLHEYKTDTTEKEPRMESSIQFETVKQSKDVAATDVQPKSTVKITRVEMQERFAESLSEPSVVPKTQTEKSALDAVKKEEDQKSGKKRTIQEKEKETMVKVEIQTVPLPAATTTTTGVRLQSADSPQVRHGVAYCYI